ncbi:sarcosine oxidase subunit alpha family protein [Ancylobacter defluvii]|uniref:Sarcosine oxidase subunit alpha n=1 Tax=Ancylobacter defluvii TaxID=1282440 RepID=A0A9W6JTE3_9HYPH|nr:sarcosine oxidase subunit alpha family protein [Ancylobacter defluvii]MBS7587452.1 sarcosine oxidase subunit alpha family protein [Ancylobacter defluvii]GLK82143.1 sarcosine oxidase subunit alpha [Ancylobacter defluvii]
MTGSFRTPSGGRIDRTAALAFRFDGATYHGFAGDTLASALLANGVHLVGRSFKYHRPRGILSAGSDEPNALVEVRRDDARITPNLRATQVELYEGLEAASQNRWPSLARDAGAVNDLFAPFLPAGFYYKTFMWPAGAWKRFYEPKIRAMAGLGKAPTLPDPDRYTQHYAHCDVLVIGAGPAGIASALAASAGGARVILVDEQAEPGGSLLAATDAAIDTKPATQWLADALAELTAAGVVIMPRTTAFGYFPHNMIALCERVTEHLAAPDRALPRERLWQIRAKQVVIAAGALERPLVFPENDRPGVMLAESARTYLTRYGVRPGERAVIFTAADSGYRAALDLAAGGVAIAAIADLRAAPEGEWPARALAAGIDVRPSTVVAGTAGRLRVKAARLAKVKHGAVGPAEVVACDAVLMSGGFTPSVHLFSQSRGKLAWDETLGAYLPARSVERERSAGACRGRYGLTAALADGYHAGEEAAAEALKDSARPAGRRATASRAFGVVARDTGTDGFIGAVPHGRNPAFAKAFVDWQNDVTAKDIALATREGFRSIEHVKRYTTTGMATDQGKTSNMNALGIVAEQLGESVPKIGLTTFRPPYTPTTFGIFAGAARGDLFDPVRVTPIHGWAEARGAAFEPVSLWKRAHYFPEKGDGGRLEDMHAAVARECRAVRSGVGIFDASTLGKIEVVGADAAEFMNRMYTNPWSKLEPGRLRYGVMLRENGFVMDDGVVGRLAPDRFHVTTTTGGAARVLAHMEDYLQTEWPDLDVWLTSTTEQWAVIAVQGPKSREVLAPLVEGIDLSKGALPNMSVREGRIAGVPTRLFRLSFAGELGFEVNVPAAQGRAVWEAIFKAGEPFGIAPYGTETMHVLRAEKGYIIVGQETDGTAAPDDVGLGWAIGKAKKDFVGKRSLSRAAFFMPDRKQLVGLLTRDPAVVLEEGAQLVAAPNAALPVPMLGHVTSSYASATLGRSIALAMVKGGRARIGQTLYVPMPSGPIAVELVDPVFYDAEGARLDV